MKKSWLRVLSTGVLAGVLLANTALPVWAADDLITNELRVKAGSTSAFMNGKKQNITKPLTVKGVTLVPVGVFKKPSAVKFDWRKRCHHNQGRSTRCGLENRQFHRLD